MTPFYIVALLTAMGALLSQAGEGTVLARSGWTLMLAGIVGMLVVVMIP